MAFVRAVALDLDGTLALHDRPSERALRAIERARSDGVAAVLVTGRILAELATAFPDLTERFDAVVAENGAVLRVGAETRALAPAVDDALADALEAGRVPHRRGQVLLALDAEHAEAVLEQVARLGLDCQLVRNRSALMVLPAGVSKGGGLLAALAELGISPHNAVALGDAENDLALLAVAEVGVAVANAVPSVLAHADFVTERADGHGVAEWLGGPYMSGERPLRPDRRRLTIGRFDDGVPATIPGAQANILVRGDSGAGKSYLAGLLAEEWIGAGYSVLIVDMEGDYIGLERLHDVIVLGEHGGPEARELLTVLRQRSVSVVIDLSALADDAKLEYLQTLPALIEAERLAWGMPHWILVDEAHVTLGEQGFVSRVFRPADRGYCLVTYRPEQLTREAQALIDITLVAYGEDQDGGLRAALLERGRPPRDFTAARRRTPHRRHWHKYAATALPTERWFQFRGADGAPVSAAADLPGFVRVLAAADPAVVSHHLRHGDFSRWITGALQDRGLAAVVAAAERELLARDAAEVERARATVIRAIEGRYLLDPETVTSG